MNQHQTEKRVATANGDLVYYVDRAFPGRPTVVLLHGLSSNHTTWNGICETLHQHKINSIAPDLRGHGFSDKRRRNANYRWPVFVDDLEALLAAEKLEHPILVGYSYGGPIALDYTLRHPKVADKIVLISSNYLHPTLIPLFSFMAPILYVFLQIVGWLLIWQKRRQDIYYQHEKSTGYFQSVWIGLNTMPLSINMWMLSQMFLIDYRRTLHNIKTRTLIIRGKDDPFVTAAEVGEMIRLMPHATLQTTRYEGHFVATRSQHEITDMIVEFVEQS